MHLNKYLDKPFHFFFKSTIAEQFVNINYCAPFFHITYCLLIKNCVCQFILSINLHIDTSYIPNVALYTGITDRCVYSFCFQRQRRRPWLVMSNPFKLKRLHAKLNSWSPGKIIKTNYAEERLMVGV